MSVCGDVGKCKRLFRRDEKRFNIFKRQNVFNSNNDIYILFLQLTPGSRFTFVKF